MEIPWYDWVMEWTHWKNSSWNFRVPTHYMSKIKKDYVGSSQPCTVIYKGFDLTLVFIPPLPAASCRSARPPGPPRCLHRLLVPSCAGFPFVAHLLHGEEVIVLYHFAARCLGNVFFLGFQHWHPIPNFSQYEWSLDLIL